MVNDYVAAQIRTDEQEQLKKRKQCTDHVATVKKLGHRNIRAESSDGRNWGVKADVLPKSSQASLRRNHIAQQSDELCDVDSRLA